MVMFIRKALDSMGAHAAEIYYAEAADIQYVDLQQIYIALQDDARVSNLSSKGNELLI